MTIEDRLRARLLVTPSGCWEWQGSRHPTGYGRIALSHSTSDRTHRVAYRLWVGPIADGLFVCHACDNPPCCNPEHLFLGTSRENTLDASQKGRLSKARRAVCVRGHELLPDNIYLRPDNGKRMCLRCHHERARSWRTANYVPKTRTPPTHCPAGHEYPPDRRCRPCNNAASRRYKARVRAALAG